MAVNHLVAGSIPARGAITFEDEDMLTIELVPKTCWYSNLRSELPKKDWDFLRKLCYKKANNVCEICGGSGSKWPVECHEIWEYEDNTKTQILKGLIALCPSCHEVKHIGLAQIKGNYNRCLTHLSKVNDWDLNTAENYVKESFSLWKERSRHKWVLDISWLNNIIEQKEK